MNSEIEQNENVEKSDDQIIELNQQMKIDFMSYCNSFLNDDNEARQCVDTVWNKYLQCVGDVATLSTFFDILPYHVKIAALPKYQNEINQWCKNLFHINFHTLLCSTYYSETFQRVIRYAMKNKQYKKAIIYIPTDFDPNLKIDLTSSLANIKFEQISNDNSHEDMININQLEEFIKRDINDAQAYPFMVIANAGSALLGRCDELTRIKKLCDTYDIWLHAIGDLLGSLALLSTKDNINLSCDSLTMDIMKLFGIQNLPYLTFYLRSISTNDDDNNNNNNSLISSNLFDDFILHSPSINFLSIWSINQRCTNEKILYHMKKSFDLTKLLLNNLKQIKTLQILNEEDNQQTNTYQRICFDNTLNDILPKPVVIFRFQSDDTSDIENLDDFNHYIDLLNLWLFDKVSQQYPKMNLEMLKSIYFQKSPIDDNTTTTTTTLNQIPVHAFRFAPLEHLLDTIEQTDMQAFTEDLQRHIDIVIATMTARKNLLSSVAKYENLISIPLLNWAGIGAIRYIPNTINPSEINEASTYEINTIQAELARQLQTNDTAFSLGGGTDENDSMFYIRLGMIRKPDDLNILLEKIFHVGKETESSLKYVEDMAEKIKIGIEKVQKDLYDENLQLLAQEGILRQVPLISNIISWWSPASSGSTLTTKGRSFDLNSGQIESTENTYVYRMQVKKQSSHAPTHNNNDDNDTINPNQ